ncbi:hypothetical protein [Geminisphaera colitermitum]|uniref:hypothetical protein n=1 Tax=Geminisphaera colitermitum TaxID=1148786 RepID=UPI0005B8BA4F|nr:hypothetical protein [Geminisphaera colitermitum]
MRASLRAVTDELKRLKAEGVTSLPVSPESIARLREVIDGMRNAESQPAAQPAATPAAPAASSALDVGRSTLDVERSAQSAAASLPPPPSSRCPTATRPRAGRG